MLKLRGELDLAAEPFTIHAGGQFRWQDLDDHLSIQRTLGGDEYSAHPAAGQFAVESIVGAERRAQLRFERARSHHVVVKQRAISALSWDGYGNWNPCIMRRQHAVSNAAIRKATAMRMRSTARIPVPWAGRAGVKNARSSNRRSVYETPGA